MKFKFAIFEEGLGVSEDRITFSREELLAMRNSLDDNDPEMSVLIQFIDHMEKTLIAN